MRRPMLFLLVTCGCATARVAPPAMSWPPAPQQARVIYRGEIRGERGVVEPSGWQRFTSWIAGAHEPDVLQAPFAVAFDGASRLLVTDRARGAVVIIDQSRGEYRVFAPRGDRSLLLPTGVAADAEGRIYVADAGRKVVTVLSADGEPVGRIDLGGALQRPTGVAVDRARRLLYVVDTPAHVVRVLTLEGRPVRELGGHGSGPGEMNFPTFVAVDAAGRVLVNDTMNFRVETFGADGSFLSAFGRPGNGSGDLDRPKGIAVDASRRVYVADASFDNFQIFDSEGRLLLFVGEHGRGPGQFWIPAGLAVSGNRVAVVDSGNARVLLFEVVTPAEVP